LRHSNDHPNNGNADGFGNAGMICVLVLVVAFFTLLLLTLNIGTDIAEQFPSPFLAEAGYAGLQTPDYESLGNSILNSFVGTYVLLMWNMYIGVNKASIQDLERSAHMGTYERRSSYCHEHVGGSSALRVPDRHYHAMEFPTEYGKCYSCVIVNDEFNYVFHVLLTCLIQCRSQAARISKKLCSDCTFTWRCIQCKLS
jgi:hypothetical protein